MHCLKVVHALWPVAVKIADERVLSHLCLSHDKPQIVMSESMTFMLLHYHHSPNANRNCSAMDIQC